jgi:uncharacterized protein
MLVGFGGIKTMSPASRSSPWVFFLLVLLLSVPFYGLGAAGGRLPILTVLPTSALMAFTPMIAALILAYRDSGWVGATNLLYRAFDLVRVRNVRWHLVAIFFLPIVAVLQYVILRTIGTVLPPIQVSIGEAPLFLVMFFLGAIGEELGWQGYAFPELRTSFSALSAALLLGGFWALWHVIPFVQMGRGADWIVWHGLSLVAMRVIVVWLFLNAGQSVFIAVLFHTMSNMPWGVIANYGSYYDPFMTFVLLTLAAGAIVACWGSTTLARFRNA